jgi:hypothetical protein
MPRLLALILAGAVGALGMARAADVPSVRTALETLAAKMPCLDTSGLLWDRLPDISSGWISAGDEAPYRRGVADLIALQAGEADLLPLLKHRDPKVRTLAMAKLLMNDDARALPALVALAHDPAPTFPNPQPEAATLAMSGIGPPPKDQTVGDIATAIGNFYLNAAGYGGGIDRDPGFPAYWQAHKDCDHCASWFLVEMMRAIQGTAPIRADRVDKIRQVRARIDRLPEPDRDWTLLFLGHSWQEDPNDPDPRADTFISEEEMIKIGQRLGPHKLVLALQQRIPCDDPDMQADGMGSPGSIPSFSMMRLFLLHHATQLLRPQDADALLAQRQAERARENGLTSAWWTIAAARLQPARADSLLRDDLVYFAGPKQQWNDGYDQADLGLTLWQMEGETEAAFLTDWFYGDLSKKNGRICPDACSRFIDGVAGTPSGRKLLAKIAGDPRYQTLSAYSTMSLAKAVNRWTPQPIVSDAEIGELYGQPPQVLVLRLLERLHQSVPAWRE